MKKQLVVLFAMLCVTQFTPFGITEGFGQVGIGTPTPDSSAILELQSSNKGFLIPRSDTDSVAVPATGLLIYQNSDNQFYYFNGTNWTSALGDMGPVGPSGTPGTNGINGIDGADGATGPPGPTGAAGTDGNDGATGLTGATGAAGANGVDGATGPTGATGAAGTNGADGATGPTGATGAAGTNGADGATGPTGSTGTAGTNGADGATGPTGATGTAGTNGADGATGPTGATGTAGTNGADGATGPTGATGTAGTNGADGATGPTGATGTAGADGATGPTGATGTAGTNGADGATGPTGVTGTAGTNGADGATGPTGATGTAGTNGADGATGPTGATGTAGTNGTNGATGPTGATGATGAAGADGALNAWSLTGNAGLNPATNYVGTSDNVPFGFRANNTELMRIDTSGNIGIGTTTPSTKLHLFSEAIPNLHIDPQAEQIIEGRDGRLQIISLDIGTGASSINLTNTPAVGDNSHWHLNHVGVSIGDGLLFRHTTTSTPGTNTFTAAGYKDVMYLQETGNVGIGTTTPGAQLHVYGPNAGILLEATGGGDPFVQFTRAGTFVGQFQAATDTTISLTKSDGTPKFTMNTSNGKVGINNTNPVYQFDVGGSIRATGSVYYGGTVGVKDGTLYAKPDFVFEEGYYVMETSEVEKFLKKEGHLPWLTSANKDLRENSGAIDMTRMGFETVETAENLQLQIIRLKKELEELKRIVEEIKN